MNLNFLLLCTVIVVTALLTIYGLNTLLWDAVSGIEQILIKMPSTRS